jgi:hypothetical protein
LEEVPYAFPVSGLVYTEGKVNKKSYTDSAIQIVFPNGRSGCYITYDMNEIDLREIPPNWQLHPNYEVDRIARIATDKAMVMGMIQDNTIIIEDSDNELIPDVV